jgi:hemerythrin
MSSDSKNFLEWREAWLLDHESIDSQHLGMARLLNQIADSQPAPPQSRQAHLELLLQLQEATREHFGHEESMMRESDYSELAAHHREHAVLLAELQDFIREFEAGEKSLNTDALTSLKHWFIDHILTADRMFVRYLQRTPMEIAEDDGP